MIWIEEVRKPTELTDPFDKWNSMDEIIDTLRKRSAENDFEQFQTIQFSNGFMEGIAEIDPEGTFTKKDLSKLTMFFNQQIKK